jgi:hypothetical protein
MVPNKLMLKLLMIINAIHGIFIKLDRKCYPRDKATAKTEFSIFFLQAI